MLRLRYGSIVPPGGVNLAYVLVPPALPSTHLSMGDYSVDIPENVADNYGNEITPSFTPLTATRFDTDEVVVSPRSMLGRNITRPVKLYYQYDIGGGTRYVRDEIASTTDFVSAAQTIRQHLQILDGVNNATSDLLWDIEVTGLGPVANSFAVRLYTNRIGTRQQTFKVKYQAVNATDDREPNRREVINGTPILSAGVDYTITDLGASGFEISGLASGNRAPGLGLFYDGTGSGSVTIDATEIDFGGSNKVAHFDAGSGLYRPMADVVADINALNVTYTAVALTDHVAHLDTGTFAITTTGTVIRLLSHAHLQYQEQFRIRPTLPLSRSAREPWYPRINKGSFTRIVTGDANGPYRYKLQDFEYQVWNVTYGKPYKDTSLEEPEILDSQRLRVRHYPIKAFSDITVFVDDVEHPTLLDQADLANGILFLTRPVEANQNIRVSYVYEERHFIYQGVNLNPTLSHNPDFLKRYVGVYMIPHRRLGAGETFERTIYHMIRDSAEDVRSAVAALEFTDGNSAEAKLLAIYSVRQTEDPNDLTIIDVRTDGGGLREDLLPRDVVEDEARFYSDVGGHYDGEPFPDAATLIVEIPDGLPGTRTPETIYESMNVTGTIDPTGWINPTGLLSEDEIRKKITRHAEAGAFVIEDFYPEP